MDIFSERLKAARKRLHLTQEQLAVKSYVPTTTIAQFETNKRKPSFETLRRLAAALDITADYLLGLTDKLVMVQAHEGIMKNYEKMSGDDRELFKQCAKLLTERNTTVV
jgi:transcriptional regulator with XRE-family HTH domain